MSEFRAYILFRVPIAANVKPAAVTVIDYRKEDAGLLLSRGHLAPRFEPNPATANLDRLACLRYS